VYVTSGIDTEIQLTLEAMVEFVNALLDADGADVDTRALLVAQGFPRAAIAPEPAVRRVTSRFRDLVPRLISLPGLDAKVAAVWVNAELTELAITPSLSDHDGFELHIHWTQPSATFDDQVLADILMALSQDLCDNGTKRFGRCAARDCEHLFYDSTRNGSRRFCSDPRCASRTHTADHRKRRKKT
jgi:predicted RNA-binding Zn ribbon-like protein